MSFPNRISLVIGIVLLVSVIGTGGFIFGPDVFNHPEKEYVVDIEETVNNSSEINGSVIRYEKLSQEKQEVFDRALNDSDGNARTNDGSWTEYEVVKYEKKTYRIEVSVIN
ncbi:hypothetical protein ACT4ML_15420 [Natrinema sp. LN54]|uniref:hypothetical protein n=1 Tax=Natrinema sp. LN54 TaxID=3458705 RepID=UPI0040356665